MKKSFIGERLINYGFLTNEELNHCLDIQTKNGKLMGVIALEYGYITEEELTKVLLTN